LEYETSHNRRVFDGSQTLPRNDVEIPARGIGNGDVGQADATSGEWQIGSFGENVGGVDGGDRYESNRKAAKEEWKPG
jgi:hypothetical protein